MDNFVLRVAYIKSAPKEQKCWTKVERKIFPTLKETRERFKKLKERQVSRYKDRRKKEEERDERKGNGQK